MFLEACTIVYFLQRQYYSGKISDFRYRINAQPSSEMSTNRLGHVWFLQIRHLVRCKVDVADRASLVQTLDAGIVEPNDGDAAFLFNPRKRHLAHLASLLLRHFLDTLVNRLVRVRPTPGEHDGHLRPVRLDPDRLRE